MSTEPTSTTTQPDAEPSWSERAGAAITRAGKTSLVVVIVAAVVFGLYLVAAAVLPRWWSQFIGGQVDGDMSRGVGLGLFYGFVFSFVPVLIMSLAARPWVKGWKAKLIVVLIGLVFALPQLAYVVDRGRNRGFGPRCGANP